MHGVEGWSSSARRASLPGAMKRLGLVLAVVVLAALGAFAAIAFFNARDDAGVGTWSCDAVARVVQRSGVVVIGSCVFETGGGNVVLL